MEELNGLMLALNRADAIRSETADHMPSRSSTSIARKARGKAEADFTTWLMMAKLGSFDDLPPNAQSWLTNYRSRLEQLSEFEATKATIQEIYVAYYQELGGTGLAPEPVRKPARKEGDVVQLNAIRADQAARSAEHSAPARSKRRLPVLVIFAIMVAVLVGLKYAFN